MRLFLAIIIVVTFQEKALPLKVKNKSQSGAGVPNGLNKPDTDHHD